MKDDWPNCWSPLIRYMSHKCQKHKTQTVQGALALTKDVIAHVNRRIEAIDTKIMAQGKPQGCILDFFRIPT